MQFIRRHSTMVKIPGFLVKAVCRTPFGAHPQGLAADSIGLEGYSEDYDFLCDFVEASRDARGLKEWIEEWVLRQRTQEEYSAVTRCRANFFSPGQVAGGADGR